MGYSYSVCAVLGSADIRPCEFQAVPAGIDWILSNQVEKIGDSCNIWVFVSGKTYFVRQV